MSEPRYIIEARHEDHGNNWDSDFVGTESYTREQAEGHLAELKSDPEWEGWEFRYLVDRGDGHYRPE